jgi:hypothetical protein
MVVGTLSSSQCAPTLVSDGAILLAMGVLAWPLLFFVDTLSGAASTADAVEAMYPAARFRDAYPLRSVAIGLAGMIATGIPTVLLFYLLLRTVLLPLIQLP